MRTATLATFALAVGLGLITGNAVAQAPVTATCKDGTTWTGNSRSGACRGHQGVQAYGTAAASAPSSPAQTPPAASPATAPATTSPLTPPAAATSTSAATGGGPGMVWVNTASKVYHCQNDRYYGKTKAGKYLSESAAKAEGDRASGGKTCSS